ncbi:hypothetical protein DdX_10989 [Ditylenchus destructor]|uniref:Uncharacterized protein n=1 Tax=Ditylenchus destructor TaxID=166010 RepID=A0AAD4R4Z5_9BILA|nr:hypothetical protein DdX_10989 [Ditylenchus destructor]
MNENAKPIPIRINNRQKSLYPSFPLDLTKERAASQEINFPLPIDVTSEEFVNWVVFSKLVSPMKERLEQLGKPSKSKKNGAGNKINVRLQIFVYQSCSPGTVGKSCDYCAPNPYVNIVDVVSDSLASDSDTAKRDQEIGVSNLEPETKQGRRLLLFTQTKIQGIKKRREAQDVGFINITMNVHSSEKLWFTVGFDHKSPTVTYFIDLGRDLWQIQSKMLLLRTNPVQKYGVDWLPRPTDVTSDNDPFYVEFRAMATKRAAEENKYLVGKFREIYREGAK